MASFVRRSSALVILSAFFYASHAQPAKKETRPYKISTSGKRISIKSNKNIQHIMLWTSSGHRVVEQRDIHAGQFTFIIPVNEKIYFLMVGLENGKVYTEKIGIQ